MSGLTKPVGGTASWGSPFPVGPAASDGVAATLVRSDHVHEGVVAVHDTDSTIGAVPSGALYHIALTSDHMVLLDYKLLGIVTGTNKRVCQTGQFLVDRVGAAALSIVKEWMGLNEITNFVLPDPLLGIDSNVSSPDFYLRARGTIGETIKWSMEVEVMEFDHA